MTVLFENSNPVARADHRRAGGEKGIRKAHPLRIPARFRPSFLSRQTNSIPTWASFGEHGHDPPGPILTVDPTGTGISCVS